jgi:hypothetical protein
MKRNIKTAAICILASAVAFTVGYTAFVWGFNKGAQQAVNDSAVLTLTLDQNGAIRPINGLTLQTEYISDEHKLTLQQMIDLSFTKATTNFVPDWVYDGR